jgi:hypothetical protein
MNQKESVELSLKLSAECKKHPGCDGCPFIFEMSDGKKIKLCEKSHDASYVWRATMSAIPYIIERRKQLDGSYAMSDKTSDKMSDNVNHPSHYTQGGIECIEAIKAATVNLTGIEAVCTANAIKYLWRWKEKNGKEDLKKAIWYIKKLIEEQEK